MIGTQVDMEPGQDHVSGRGGAASRRRGPGRATRAGAVTRLLALAALVAAAALGPRSPALADAATEANITRVTAGILGSSSFSHRRLDEDLARTFLDHYLETLDGERSLFLRSDVEEFEAFRATLAHDTLRAGDSRVAHAVFARYLERLGQRAAFVGDALRTATFEFTGDDVYSLDRANAARPADMAAARELWWQQLRYDYLREKLDGKDPEKIAATLDGRARRQLLAMTAMTREQVLEVYLSALARIYDPHSDYLGHDQLDEFAISMNLSLFGIGARLRSVDGQCTIVDLIPGGPAALSGSLGPNDRIVGVAQEGGEPVDVVDMPLRRIVDLIRGPKGSVVRLTVIPASAGDDAARRTVRLVRDEIRLEEQRAKARVLDLPTGAASTLRLGVIDLPSFYADLGHGLAASDGDSTTAASATADVARLLSRLKAEAVEGIVLDLRRNGGGSLREAVELTGLFISEGPVVQTRGPRGDVNVEADTDPAEHWKGPLLVLTSRFSASASEIVAGALQDYDRAIIVGDASTFGKGTVQSVMPLAPLMSRAGLGYAYDPGALTVTIRKFYRPSGSSTQLRGVEPDIVVPSPTGVSEVGETELDNPLPWDAVPRAHYRPVGAVSPHLAALRDASARRIEAIAEFALMRAEVARLRDRIENRTVSLNEAARRQELARAKERREAYEEAMKALDAAAPRSYEVKLGGAAGSDDPSPRAASGEADTRRAADAEAAEDPSEPAPGGGAPQRDIVLIEAARILADYAALQAGATGAATLQVRSPAAAQPLEPAPEIR